MALNRNPLFVGCTRPAMMMGVTMNFFIANGMVSSLVYLMANNPIWLLLFIPLHAIAYGLCRNEPRMLSLMGLWAKTKGACVNRFYWKASSYTPFERARRKRAPR